MVKERMDAVVKGQVSSHTRPLLLFPEVTQPAERTQEGLPGSSICR